MSTALDVGVHRMRSLRRRHARVIGRKTRSAFAVLPDTPSRRRVLDRTRIPFAVCEDSLLLMGDHAAEFAPSFQTPLLPLLPGGNVPTSDAPARQVLAALVQALLPEPVEQNEICCVALPDPDDEAFPARVLRLNGYEPIVISRGLAVVLSELVDKSFSGIGIDFGSGSTELVLAHRGTEIARHQIAIGGDWIDEQLAHEFREYAWDGRGHRYLDTDAIGCWKSNRGSILEPKDDRDEFLGELYTELISKLLEESAADLEGRSALVGLPVPLTLVCAGGVGSIEGFDELLTGIVERIGFPVEIGSVRLARDSDYTVARGCLINAELEADVRKPRVA